MTTKGTIMVWLWERRVAFRLKFMPVAATAFTCLLSAACNPHGSPEPGVDSGSGEERIAFVSQEDTLVGYLSKPASDNRYPVVIILHSASAGNHDAPLYNHLKKALNEIGVAVFSYDRRGYGQSKGDFATAGFSDLANDAIAAADLLRKRNDIIRDKVGLFGVSQGGWIAPLASQMDATINFLILVSSCGTTPARQMAYTTRTTMGINGYNDSIVEEGASLRHVMDEYYRGRLSLSFAQKIVDGYKNEPWFFNSYLPVGRDGKLPDVPKESKWWLEMDFNPGIYFSKIEIPVALFYGSSDRWVPIEESISFWESALLKANNTKYQIFRIKNAGHLMIENEDDGPVVEKFSDQYREALQEFVKKVVGF
jgi:hypothetical protein